VRGKYSRVMLTNSWPERFYGCTRHLSQIRQCCSETQNRDYLL